MTNDFLVLGADGQQGIIVTKYLLKKGYRILVSDLYRDNVLPVIARHGPKRAGFVFCDLSKTDDIVALIKKSQAPIVINCADMYFNLNVYNACLETQRHCVDLGSWIELTLQQLRMDRKFKQIGRIAITGCGSLPGIGNVMLKYAAKKFDSLKDVDVGFSWNSNMKKFVVPFSLKSILEELTYDPKIMYKGKYINKKPMEVSFHRNFRLVGPQRVYMVQHPEVSTFWHYFKNQDLEKVRFFAGFPEHSLKEISALITLGFHSDKPVKFESHGVRIAPFDLLNPVLKRLKTPKGYTESENLWLKITGKKNGKRKIVLMECLIPPVKGWEDSGCNIDTGFPVCIMAEMIKEGLITTPGSFAPEAIVPEMEFFRRIKRLGFKVLENGQEISYT